MGEDFVHVETLLGDLVEVALYGLLAFVEDENFADLAQELKLVGDQDDALGGQCPLDCLVEDAVSHGWVYS